MSQVVIKLFVADRHDGIRQLVCDYGEHDPAIEVVGDASEWAQIKAQLLVMKPHVLLVDPDMPGLKFEQLVELVLDKCPGTRIIIFSLHADGVLAASYLSSGAQGYLLKDCMLGELGSSMQAVNAGKLYVSPAVGRKNPNTRLPSRSEQ